MTKRKSLGPSSRAPLCRKAVGSRSLLAVLALPLLLMTSCSDSKDSKQQNQTSLSPTASYWADNRTILLDFSGQAKKLSEIEGDEPLKACEAITAELTRIGTAEATLATIQGIPDPVLREAFDEQFVGVQSSLAACRGDAPVSFSEANKELKVSILSVTANLVKAELN